MQSSLARLLTLALFAILLQSPSFAQETATRAKSRPPREKEDPKARAQSLRALAERLGVGAGATIADIGAGNGRDSWVFAEIVGAGGKVLSEEIEEDKVDELREAAESKGLAQVEPVLGGIADPGLPEATVDMAFMHQVYHHVTKPREMLQGIWKALKPGGYLVVVDRRLGTLQDWVPREQRGPKHFWIAETTVVREAREQGFRFTACAEDCWHVKDAFVLVFQRPDDWSSPEGDPQAPKPWAADVVQHLLPEEGARYRRVAFVALGEGRSLLGILQKKLPSEAVDIVLEEWATQKDERPALPEGVTMPSTLTEQGDPKLGDEPLDAVYFLDTYHLLFHAPALLEKLHERLSQQGRVYVLDRRATVEVSRREASHRRMIAPKMVRQEMAAAGFSQVRRVPVGGQWFLLVFGKQTPPHASPGEGPQE